MWGIVGIVVGFAVAAMSVAAPFVFRRLQFIAVPLFILGAVVAVGAIGFGVWWEMGKPSIAVPLFILGAVVAVGAIGFGVWWSIQKRGKPAFRLKISSANVFIFEGPPKKTGIVLDAEIWNTGGPSLVTDWSLSVIPKGGLPEVAKVRAIPDPLKLAGQPSIVIHGADALDAKTSAENIPKKPLKGKLLFQVSLEHQTVLDESTTLELLATDIYGTRFPVRTTIGEL